MKPIQFKALLPAVIALFLSANSWAGRILIQDESQTVVLNRALDCYRPADITIDTPIPEFFEPGSRQLQTIGDTVHAMLGYECPGLSEINITGLIRGLNETIYQGRLSARDDWRVRAIPEGKSGLTQTATPASITPASDSRRDDILKLTGLALGMSITEAKTALETAYNSTPQYDAQSGKMSLQTGGCPADFEPERDADTAAPGWKCLTAWFSDQRIPVLERVELAQVLESDSSTVKQILFNKYGQPAVVSTSPQNTEQNLQWLSINGAQTLDATLSDIDPARVLTRLILSRQSGGQTTNTASIDIGLKL